jgi:hypothetical protein
LTGRTAHDGRTKQGERPGFFDVPWFSWRTKRFFRFFDVLIVKILLLFY